MMGFEPVDGGAWSLEFMACAEAKDMDGGTVKAVVYLNLSDESEIPLALEEWADRESINLATLKLKGICLSQKRGQTVISSRTDEPICLYVARSRWRSDPRFPQVAPTEPVAA